MVPSIIQIEKDICSGLIAIVMIFPNMQYVDQQKNVIAYPLKSCDRPSNKGDKDCSRLDVSLYGRLNAGDSVARPVR